MEVEEVRVFGLVLGEKKCGISRETDNGSHVIQDGTRMLATPLGISTHSCPSSVKCHSQSHPVYWAEVASLHQKQPMTLIEASLLAFLIGMVTSNADKLTLLMWHV